MATSTIKKLTNATTSAAGLMSAADKTRLNSCITGVEFLQRSYNKQYTVNANSTATVDFGDISVSGYNILGVYGFNPGGTTTSMVEVNLKRSSDSHAFFRVHNCGSATQTNNSAWLLVMYYKITT